MEILKPDGKLVSGLPCIYHLHSNLTLFSEAVKEDGDSYIFDPAKTLQLITQPTDDPKKMNVLAFKGFQGMPFQPTSLRAGKGGTIVTDCTDPKLLAQWRSILSGIILPPGARNQNPGRN